MKRKREATSSLIRSAVEELSAASVSGDFAGDSLPCLPVKPFLSFCRLLVHVLDEIGSTMAVLRQDVHQNIQRIEKFHESNPSTYWNMVEILRKEVKEGKAKRGHTCSKSFVWLIRSLDFSLSLLRSLAEKFDTDMGQAVQESYSLTLKPFHGWISSAAYRIALKLLPDSRDFVNVLKGGDETEEGDDDDDVLRREIETLVSELVPFLEQNKMIMGTYGLDKLRST